MNTYIDIKELPKYNGSVDGSYIIGINPNGASCTIPVANVNLGLTVGGVTPSDASDTVATGNVVVGATGLFTYDGDSWGVSPKYSSNWEDLSSTTRFLLVNDLMNLSDSEKAYAWANIDPPAASKSTAGIVKASDTFLVDGQGTGYVPTATTTTYGLVKLSDSHGTGSSAEDAASVGYVNSVTSAIEVPVIEAAEEGKLGAIIPSDSVIVTNGVATVPTATDTISGITMIDSDITGSTSTSKAATTSYVQQYVTTYTTNNPTPTATANTSGVVIPGSGMSITSAGVISVKDATSSVAGVVTIIDSFSDTYSDTAVAPAKLVSSLVDTMSIVTTDGYIESSKLPVASSSSIGCVKSSATVLVDGNTGEMSVPTATVYVPGVYTRYDSTANTVGFLTGSDLPAIKTYVTSESSDSLYATATTAGGVRVTLGAGDVNSSGSYAFSVPTVTYMTEAIEDIEDKIYTEQEVKAIVVSVLQSYSLI